MRARIWLLVLVFGLCLFAGVEILRDTRPLSRLAGLVQVDDPYASPIPEVDDKQRRTRGVGPLRNRPGQAITVTLDEPPAEWYGEPGTVDNEAFYAGRIAAVDVAGAVFDGNLSIAVSHILHHSALLGRALPSGARRFLLRSAGAVDGSVTFYYLQTNAQDVSAVDRALEAALPDRPAEEGIWRIGVGEVMVPGEKLNRRIGILMSPRAVEFEVTSRYAEIGDKWVWNGWAPASYRDLRGMAYYPNGVLENIAVERKGRSFSMVVPTGEQSGTMLVQLLGTRRNGPGTLAQVPVEIEGELPWVWHGQLPPDESQLTSEEGAERYLLGLINDERARRGLAALEWDASLTEIARSHSADMRDNNFFGHRSPTTGMLSDRLRTAGYLAVTSGENVALDASLTEAHAGLMHSISHRANILGQGFSHVGVGTAGRDDDGSIRWWVTQVFARPVRPLDEQRVRRSLLRRINARRTERRLRALSRSKGLERVARRFASQAAGRQLDGIAAAAIERAKAQHLLKGSVRTWVAAGHDIENTRLPDEILEPKLKTVGMGTAQDRDTGTVGLVIFLTQ